MIHRNKNNGFTLVELMLAMAFVTFILIFIVTTLIQVLSTYNKGLAVKQINQTARATVEDMARFLRTADPSKLVVSSINDGRACFGSVSYVWNKYDVPAGIANKYDDNSSLTFSRVDDRGSAMCIKTAGAYPTVPRASSTDVLTGNVWVFDVIIAPSAGGNLIDIGLQLAIADSPVDPALVGGVCVGARSGQYCATASFTTTVATRGGH